MTVARATSFRIKEWAAKMVQDSTTRDRPVTKASHFQTVVNQICDGSEDAIWEFIDTYGAHMQRYVRKKLNDQMPLRARFDSQDFIQMVWVSFFADRETISRFQSPNELIWYLVAMARNKLISELRRSHGDKGGDIRRTQSLDSVERSIGEPQGPAASPSRVAVAREELERLLNDGSAKERRIIELRLMGKTFVQIGEELGINERTARRAVGRLVQKSRDIADESWVR